MSTYIEIEQMGEPEEIEISPRHAVLEYAVCVSVHQEGTDELLASDVEVLQIGWREGDEKPSLVYVKTDAAEHLIESPEVLAELKEAVAYHKDLLRAMN